MDPCPFHEKEVVMAPPEGQHENMAGLRVLPITYKGGETCLVSAWVPTPEELEDLNAGKPIFVGVLGHVHPAMTLTTDRTIFGLEEAE